MKIVSTKIFYVPLDLPLAWFRLNTRRKKHIGYENSRKLAYFERNKPKLKNRSRPLNKGVGYYMTIGTIKF